VLDRIAVDQAGGCGFDVNTAGRWPSLTDRNESYQPSPRANGRVQTEGMTVANRRSKIISRTEIP
jgi:hypothetical protein